MKVLFICVAVILGSCTLIFAQQSILRQDSVIDLADFKHNKQYFLVYYGRDDSTKALINTFFKVRRAAVAEVAFSVVVGGGLYLFANHVFGPGDNKSFGYGTVFLAIFAVPLIPASVVGIAEGTVTHLIYNRKKLLYLIANYQAGKHLPRRFTHRARYRQELRKVKGLKPSIWDILLFNPLF